MNSEDRLSGGKLFAFSITAGALGGLAMTTVMLLLATLFNIATPLTLAATASLPGCRSGRSSR